MDSPGESLKEFIKNSKMILTSQKRFRSEKYNRFTEELNKTALSTDEDKRIQSIDSIETYPYGTSGGFMWNKQRLHMQI